jgi:hypothetical protein
MPVRNSGRKAYRPITITSGLYDVSLQEFGVSNLNLVLFRLGSVTSKCDWKLNC